MDSNGWKNHQTWVINVHIANDPSLLRDWDIKCLTALLENRDRAAAMVADQLKDRFVRDAVLLELMTDAPTGPGSPCFSWFWTIAVEATREVCWEELGNHMITRVLERYEDHTPEGFLKAAKDQIRKRKRGNRDERQA